MTISSLSFLKAKVAGITAAVAGLALVLGVASPAYAVPAGTVSATWVSEAHGYAAVYGDGPNKTNAVSQNLKIEDGAIVEVYCVDIDKGFDNNAAFTASARSGSSIPNLGRSAWIAKNSSTVAGALSDPDLESVAVQLAVWKLTNNIDLVPSKVGNRTDVVDRSNALVAAATELPEGLTGATIVLTAQPVGQKIQIIVTVQNPAGAPLSGKGVVITAAGQTFNATTDNAGHVYKEIDPITSGDKTIKATFTGTLAAGTLLVPSNGSQPVITTGDVTFVRSASTTAPDVTVPANTPTTQAPATTVPSATPTTAPVSAPQTTATQLPYTGEGPLESPWVILGFLGITLVSGGFLYRRYLRHA